MTTRRPTTYGQHAELAAAAVTRLLADQTLPVGDSDVALMLRFRDAVVDSLRQRLFDLGTLPNIDRPPRRTDSWTPVRDDLIPIELAAVAGALPRSQTADDRAPSELFAQRSHDLTVDRWRTAAIESLAASNALSSHRETWTISNPEAQWVVLRDLAVQLEAVVVLDDRLREVGLLNQHDAPSPPASLEESRALLGQVARIATWRSLSDAADHLAPTSRPDDARDLQESGPVRIVRRVSDVAAAQDRLARALKPINSGDSTYDGAPHLSARAARHVVVGQLYLAQITTQHLCSQAAPGSCDRLDDRSQHLAEIDRHLAYLIDDDPRLRMAGTVVYWQQSEITTSLQRLLRDRELRPLTAREADDLEDASRAACRQFGIALRRELRRDDSNLRLADPSGQVGPTRVHRNAPLDRALTALVQDSQPVGHDASMVSVQRAVLQQTVDTTPTPTSRQHLSASAPAHAR
ncbi:hypothetical protein [Nocardioides dongkuii]|uniref:hypothetical protein n=1 Tax=Nocardioides dongkuii TaxID=2760089 RepID=UPI001878FAE3|nr:hypothetical protein [Nocardioides dongkuii]